ncbi:MAG: hypothetical protein M3P06_25805 [Acidobacteriota bacterium]|nr:hypothetical protein [Acidobacteriota bacterium]
MLVLALLTPLGAEAARRRAAAHPGLSFIEVSSQGGYASRTSVFQGGSVTFHIASAAQPLSVEIVNLAEPDRVLMTIENLTSHAQSCAGKSRNGCEWDATTTIFIPSDWPSGYYAARFPTSFGQRWAPFIVRAAQPANASKILLLSATHTMQATNRFGVVAVEDRVSYQRPYSQNEGLAGYSDDEQVFVDWLTAEDVPFEVASDVDLEDPTLLSRYHLVIIAGRSAYWTSRARENIEQYSRNGGHIAVFNGSTMWRQVRLEDDNLTIAGTLPSGPAAPDHGQQLVAANWFDSPLFNPETRFFGTSLRYGGHANHDDDDALLPLEQRTGWTVLAPTHWIYVGTNLVYGSTFGRETVGLEVGGSLLNCDTHGNIIGIDASAGTPANYSVLAWTPASEGTGTMGIYTISGGGAVFNAASQRWVHGLRDNPIVSRITRNIIDQFVTGEPVPHSGKTAMMLTEETFNCQQRYTLHSLPGWKETSEARATVTERCAYEGTAGLEFSGADGIEIIRDFTPTDTHKEIGARFYINVDSYQGTAGSPLARVALRNTVGQQSDEPLVVEFSNVDGKPQTRLIRRDSAGNRFASDWLELGGGGWHLVWLTWRSPGEIVLQMDKIPTRTLTNTDGSQTVGEITFELPQAGRSDSSGYVCIDTLAVGKVKPGSVPPNP